MTPHITRILVPTDFSAPSDLALEYGKTLADQFGASLHLLHVVEDPFAAGAWSSEMYVADTPQLRASLRLEAGKRLERCLPPADRDRYHATFEVITGSPASAIRDVAVDRHADLIVMGTHGRAGLTHLLLGSVAEKLVRTSPCPVLTVRGDGHVAATEREVVPAAVIV